MRIEVYDQILDQNVMVEKISNELYITNDDDILVKIDFDDLLFAINALDQYEKGNNE